MDEIESKYSPLTAIGVISPGAIASLMLVSGIGHHEGNQHLLFS